MNGGDGAAGAIFAPLDANVADRTDDAPPIFSCAAPGDRGARCIQFDPGYPDPAGVCAAQGGGAVVNAPCSLDGSAGGCHVAAQTSGYTIWSYGPQTAGDLIVRCAQRGESYVSPSFDTSLDAAADGTGSTGVDIEQRL
jgi:hypothetical protein